MDETKLRTIEQLKEFLAATPLVAFSGHGEDALGGTCQYNVHPNVNFHWRAVPTPPNLRGMDGPDWAATECMICCGCPLILGECRGFICRCILDGAAGTGGLAR